MTTDQEMKLVDRYVGLHTLLHRALPADHPVVERADALRVELDNVEPEPEEEPGEDWHGRLCDLVEVIEDWQRGIRDWDEVAVVLGDAQAAVA